MTPTRRFAPTSPFQGGGEQAARSRQEAEAPGGRLVFPPPLKGGGIGWGSRSTGHAHGWLRAASIALFSGAMLATGSAQSDYPSRPVQLIVPYAAGGIADAGMRILAEKLAGRLKQAFVVDNRPGAGGIVAAKAGAAAPPDGY